MSERWMTAAVLGAILITAPSWADEVKKIEGDDAKKLAQTLVEASGKLDALPVKIMPTLDKGTGLTAKQRALFVVPDSRLKLDALKKLDRDIVPLGLLYGYRITPVVAEQALAEDQHRTIEATIKDNKAKLSLMQLAVTKVADRPVLLIYTNGKTPALVTTLIEVDDAKDLPLELDARKGGDNQATVIVTVLGRYRAAFSIAGQD